MCCGHAMVRGGRKKKEIFWLGRTRARVGLDWIGLDGQLKVRVSSQLAGKVRYGVSVDSVPVRD